MGIEAFLLDEVALNMVDANSGASAFNGGLRTRCLSKCLLCLARPNCIPKGADDEADGAVFLLEGEVSGLLCVSLFERLLGPDIVLL